HAVRVPVLREHGHDRTQCGGRRLRVAARQGLPGLADVALRAHLPVDWVSQPAVGHDAVGVLVRDVPTIGASYHRRRFVASSKIVATEEVWGWLTSLIIATGLVLLPLPSWLIDQAYCRAIYPT